MFTPFVFILCSLSYLMFVNGDNQPTVSCRNYRSRLGTFARTLFVAGDRSMVLPKTVEEVDENFCKSIGNSITRIREISNSCLKPFAKQVTGMLIFGARKQHRKICKSTEDKKKILKYSVCLREQQLLLLHDSMDEFIDYIEAVRDDVQDYNLKIPYCCCYYQEFKRSMQVKFAPYCDKNAIDYTVDIVDGMMKDIMDLGCHTWEYNSNNCKSLLSNKPLSIKNLKKQRSRSILVPLIDIFTSL